MGKSIFEVSLQGYQVSVSPLLVSLKRSCVIASEAKQSQHFLLPVEIASALRASQ